MRYAREFAVNAVVRGVLVLLPLYLAVLVTLKACNQLWACCGHRGVVSGNIAG